MIQREYFWALPKKLSSVALLEVVASETHLWNRLIIAIVSLSDSFNRSRVDRCERHVFSRCVATEV